ncbi:MAG: hypothetical protein R3B47_17995 [Bacteroidia bacterium]
MTSYPPSLRSNSWMLVQVFALAGTIIIGFHEVLVPGDVYQGSRAQGWFWGILDGKVQAMLFILAGVALYKIGENPDRTFVRRTILREGGMLVALGLISGILWHGELLLSLGLCSLLSIPFVSGSRKLLWPAAVLFALLMPLLALVLDLDKNWNFTRLLYSNFWEPVMIPFRVFINGFYPVISWMPYVLVGIWLGKYRMEQSGMRKNILWASLLVLIVTGVGSYFLRPFDQLLFGYGLEGNELFSLFKLEKNHAMPLFIVHNTAWSLFIITSLSSWHEAFPPRMQAFYAGIASYSHWILLAQAIIAMGIIRLAGWERSLTLDQSWLLGLVWLVLVAGVAGLVMQSIKR